jgi:putative oxidoreductase
MNNSAHMAGRILLSLMFIMAGFDKIGGYEGTQQYMESMGVPGMLLPLVIITEVGGGLMVLVGFYARYAAVALGGFSVLAALFFHADFANQMQMALFMKNLTIAGGFAMLFVAGPGPWSIDARLGRENQ